MAPPNASIVAADLSVWTLGDPAPYGRFILRNGVSTGGYGTTIAWSGGYVWVLGGGDIWYRWNGSAYDITAATLPSTSVPAPAPTPEPPSASLVITGYSADGMTVTVAPSASPVASWRLEWGDGQRDAGQGPPPPSASHPYASDGNPTIKLTVWDAAGLSAEASVAGSIKFRNVNADPAPPVDPGTFAATWLINSVGPITKGAVAKQGVVPAGQGLQVQGFTTQTNVLNTWPDGSARHMSVSFIPNSTGSRAVSAIANPGGSFTPSSWPANTSATFVIGGVTYVATLPTTPNLTNTICNGPVMREAWLLVTPVNGATPHPTLQVIFVVRSYVNGVHEVDICPQNVVNSAAINQLTYNVTLKVDNSTIFSKASHIHYTGQSYHFPGWSNGASAGTWATDFEPWFLAKVVPRMVGADSATYNLADANYQLGGGASGGGGFYYGQMTPHQGDGGDRQEIGPVMGWEGRLLANNTANALLATLANGDRCGEWSSTITDTDGVSLIKLTAGNAGSICTDIAAPTGLAWPLDGGQVWRGYRHFINGASGSLQSDFNAEHVPSACFLPYLLTCRWWYLQQLKRMASWAILNTAAGTSLTESDSRFFPGWTRGRGGTLGLLGGTGVTREFAWPLKLVANAAYCCPTGDADKSYLDQIVNNNLDHAGDYVDYLVANNMGGSWASFTGGFESGAGWQRSRTAAIVGTTQGNPTTVQVYTDGVANDHDAQSGDKVDIGGLTAAGTTALNGVQRTITRVSPTVFTVPIQTTANGSGVSRSISSVSVSSSTLSTVTTSVAHGYSPGDVIAIAGVSGALPDPGGINGLHSIWDVPSSTTFRVVVDVTQAGSGGTVTKAIGTISRVTGFKCPPWRIGFTAYTIDWCIRQALWTVPSGAQAFVDRVCRMFTAMNIDNPNFLSGQSGLSHAYYPSPGYVSGDTVNWYSGWSAFATDNGHSASGRLFDSSSQYNAAGVPQGHTTHRGNTEWNDAEAELGYNAVSQVVLAIAKRRGLTNAASALTRQTSVSGHTADLLSRAHYNIGFGSEAD